MAKASSRNQITLPVDAMRAAGLHSGDEVTVRAIGDGEVLVAARGSRSTAAARCPLVLATARELRADLLTYDDQLARVAQRA